MSAIESPQNYLDVIPIQWAGIVEAMEEIVPEDRYSHWSELPDRSIGSEIGRDAWWAALKLCRSGYMRELPFRDCAGRAFKFAEPGTAGRTLHQLDRGEAAAGAEMIDPGRYGARGLVRESVASSQLAGARVEFGAAKEMLRTGRPPGNDGERMVLNNFEALSYVRAQAANELSPAMILEIHRLLTRGSPEDERGSGRLRREEEEPPVAKERPAPAPPARELPDRLDALCAFANGVETGFFVHPVIRGMILHFCLAFDCPFLEANGRAARALFCWAMKRQGYPIFDVLSFSRVLLQAPERYRRSFLLSETDDNDLTYFILAQMEAIRTALQDWREDRTRKIAELREAAGRVQGFETLNPRQQALLAHAFRVPGATYVIAGHQRSHGVTHQTARDDLFDLVDRDLLTATRERRVYHFRPALERAGRVLPRRSRRRRVTSGAAEETLPTTLL